VGQKIAIAESLEKELLKQQRSKTGTAFTGLQIFETCKKKIYKSN